MIEIKKLTKKFQNETEIKYKNLKFETGKSYMLLGSSGCGKSTLLNMIAGVLSPTSGSIIIDGVNMTEKSQKEKDKFRINNIGYVFQDFKLLDNMTVLDNINILKLEKINTSNVSQVLKELDIEEKKNSKIKHLSGGQKQRVAIARAIIKEPKIILADEPTGNLNFSIGEQVIQKLIEVSKEKTLIAVTHDERLSKYFDYTIDINDLTKIEIDEELINSVKEDA